jgi:hypothetical protein
MQKNILSRQRHHEQGQTIILVAISLVSLLAMAALAIDVVTLYVARTEIQRAADAAALAAAKAIADSGVTTLQISPPDSNLTVARSLAQTMATTAVTGILSAPAINLVAGATPTLNTLTPIPIDWSRQGNPHVTISLKASNLPTFFSKIWGGSAASVTATATAEVYNPANLPTTSITSITPIAPTSVKPWLVANVNPVDGLQFVNTSTWVVDSSIIGGPPIDLVSACTHPGPNRCRPAPNPPGALSASSVQYVPAVVNTANTQNICPACVGTTDFEQSIECADVSTSYQVLNCGGGTTQIQWDDGINPGKPPGNNATSLGGQCLIHASSEGAGGQDVLTEPTPIFSAPYQIKQQSGTLVTTSNSIVTIPILDTVPGVPLPRGGGAVTVDGFLQAFINQVDPVSGVVGAPPEGSINITVLNIVGCSTVNNGANPVVGGSGSSPIPVRLISPP